MGLSLPFLSLLLPFQWQENWVKDLFPLSLPITFLPWEQMGRKWVRLVLPNP